MPATSAAIPWRAVLAAACCAGVLCPPVYAADDPNAQLFRLFLHDGTAVACQAEYVRVEGRVVCSMPLGSETTLVSLPDEVVNWTRTEEYAAALRAERYARTRGERDFTELSVEIAGLLNEIAFTEDNARRLAIALDARQRLARWPALHHNYRAGDVQQILLLVDEAISDLRAAAGAQSFDLAFAAQTGPPPAVPLLPAPTADESVAAAFRVAELAADATERLTLLDAVQRVLSNGTSAVTPELHARLAPAIAARIDEERSTDRAYAGLAAAATSRARARAERADVRGVERVLDDVRERDAALGRRRPRQAAAIIAAIQEELDAARRLRLARDQWALRRTVVVAYQRRVRGPMEELQLMSGGLDDIKRLAGPAAPVLDRLARRAAEAMRALHAVVPPPDVASIHALLVSAAQLAGQAVDGRRDAVARGAMDRAWQASSAAAGALMLIARAREELAQALAPPSL